MTVISLVYIHEQAWLPLNNILFGTLCNFQTPSAKTNRSNINNKFLKPRLLFHGAPFVNLFFRPNWHHFPEITGNGRHLLMSKPQELVRWYVKWIIMLGTSRIKNNLQPCTVVNLVFIYHHKTTKQNLGKKFGRSKSTKVKHTVFYLWLVKMMFSLVQPITAIKAVVSRKAAIPVSTLHSFTAVALHAFLGYKAFHLKRGLY